MKVKSIKIGMIIILSVIMGTAFSASNVLAQEEIVSLNKATVEELLGIEDISIPENLAMAIVSYRTKNGPFKEPADLMKVPGMTEDVYEDINPVLDENKDVVYDPDAEPAMAPSKC